MTALNRVATAQEVSDMVAWGAEKGWNPGLEDAEALYRADPGGFWVAEVEGKAVASITVVNHSDSFAFLGLYICTPEYRGKGLGFALWQSALEHAVDRTVGLDAVAEQQANYKRSGFEPVWETSRFAGKPKPGPQDGIELTEPQHIDQMIALEAAANGYAKPQFLTAWFTQTKTRRTFHVVGEEAFYTVRRCHEGCKIAPLVAPNLDLAKRMIAHCAARHPNDDLIIDVPEDCPALAEFCAEQGMSVSFTTARMYRGTAPTPGPHIRSLASLELG